MCFAGLIGNGFTGVVSAQQANASSINIRVDDKGYLYGLLDDSAIALGAQLTLEDAGFVGIKLKDGSYLKISGRNATDFHCFGEAPHDLRNWAKSKFNVDYYITVNELLYLQILTLKRLKKYGIRLNDILRELDFVEVVPEEFALIFKKMENRVQDGGGMKYGKEFLLNGLKGILLADKTGEVRKMLEDCGFFYKKANESPLLGKGEFKYLQSDDLSCITKMSFLEQDMRKLRSVRESLIQEVSDAKRTASACELNSFKFETEKGYLNDKIADLNSKNKKLTSMNNASILTALVGWTLLAAKCIKDWFFGGNGNS